MNQDQLNIHLYDGQLHDQVKNISELITRVKNIPINTRHELLQNFINFLSYFVHDKNKLTNLFIIIQDHKQDNNKNNYDPSNNLDAIDLVLISYDLLRLETNLPDMLIIFLEQLQDMSTGLCPPGRCTRLLQFILTFI
jgi:hypothetical protein